MRYKMAEGLSVDDVDGVTVLTLENGDVAVLNGTASLMVRLFGRGDNEASIVSQVGAKYEVSVGKVKLDYCQLMGKLCREGFLVECPITS